MLNVVICDDNQLMVDRIEAAVNDAIGWDHIVNVEVECKATTPDDVIDLVRASSKPRLFFLDIDLQHPVYNGLTLGEEIRKYDVNSDVIYVTSHSEKSKDTFRYRVAALDFIVKDLAGLNTKIREAVKNADERFRLSTKTGKKFELTGGKKSDEGVDDSRKYFKDLAQIIYFCSDKDRIGKNKVELHELDAVYTFRGTLKGVESFDERLVRISGSTVINIDYVKEIYRDEYDAWQFKMINNKSLEASSKGKVLAEAMLRTRNTIVV